MNKILSIIIVIAFLILAASFIYAFVADDDQDGVPDEFDLCPGSDTQVVDQFGCSCDQKNCPSDNNECTNDCSIINRLTACVFTNVDDNEPCEGGYCVDGECVSGVGSTPTQQLNCGSQCGSIECGSHEICEIDWDDDDSEIRACKFSVECGATCGDIIDKYPNQYVIKESSCSSYDRCFTQEADIGTYSCDRNLCAGRCTRNKCVTLECGDVIKDRGIQIKWDDADADLYELEWRKEGLSFDDECPNTNPAECGYTLTEDTDAYALGLDNNQLYDFRVEAIESDRCSYLGLGRWSEIVTCPQCATPTLSCGNIVQNGIQMDWTDAVAARYRLEWRKEGLSFDESCANTNPAECGYTLTEDTNALALGLGNNQKYNFRVRVEEATTCQAPGQWADTATCTISEPGPSCANEGQGCETLECCSGLTCIEQGGRGRRMCQTPTTPISIPTAVPRPVPTLTPRSPSTMSSCGDKCEKEPPLPPGTDVISYCSRPLIVPNNELEDNEKSFPNVQANKDNEDNRYFVYVSKGSDTSTLVEVKNLNEVEIEPLLEGVSFDGNELTITDNTAFIIHGNPDKGGFFSCGWWCGEKQLELKGKTEKIRLYPTENCDELTGIITNALLESPYSEGIRPGILYAALFEVMDDIRTTTAHVIEGAVLDTPLPTSKKPLIRLIEDAVPETITSKKSLMKIIKDAILGKFTSKKPLIRLIEGVVPETITSKKSLIRLIEGVVPETASLIGSIDEEISLRILVKRGGKEVPLIEGQKYEIGTIYTTEGRVQEALEFARSLDELDITDRIRAIDGWVAENGVYPTDRVVNQLKYTNFDPFTGAALHPPDVTNIYRNPVLGDFAEKFVPGKLGELETLTNIMENELADGRFLCVCRDIAVLGTAMAREAGVEASMATGGLSLDGTLDLRKLDGTKNMGWHAWVNFRDSQGRLVEWDPTASLSDDIYIEPRAQFLTSIDYPEAFKRYKPAILETILSEGTVNVAILDEANNPINNRKVEGVVLLDNPNTKTLVYDLDFKVTNPLKIPVVKLQYPYEPYLGSFTYIASTDSGMPIIIDGVTRLTPLNRERFPQRVLDSIDAYNRGYRSFLDAPPTTARGLMEAQTRALDDLRATISDIETPNGPKLEISLEDRVRLEKSMGNVRSVVRKLQPEQAVTNALFDSLGKARTSAFQGKLATAQMLRNPALRGSFRMAPLLFLGAADPLFTFSPIFQDFANDLDNANLMLVATGLNVAEIGILPVAGGMMIKQVVSAGLAGGRSAAAAGGSAIVGGRSAAIGAAGGIARSFAMPFAIAYVASIYGTTIYCMVNPSSGLCGCRVSEEDYDGNLILELEKYTVEKDETINYRILGFENCPTPVGLNLVAGLVSMGSINEPIGLYQRSNNPLMTSATPGYQLISGRCEFQESGKWCLGPMKADLSRGDHDILIGYLVGGENSYSFTGQEITVE
jgi:hypothetical protein